MNSEFESQLNCAIAAVRVAESVIRQYYEGSFDVMTKSDASPVTRADIESEKAIREVLLETYPDYGFYGEETGTSDLDADYLWLVDPIDGTKSFVRNSPFFSTQIALMYRGELVVGVSNAPCYGHSGKGEMAFATSTTEAKLNDQVVQSSAITELGQSFLSAGNIASLASHPQHWQRYGELVAKVARTRGYGDFCHYHQLSCGQADLIVESDVNILDIAALTVVVRQSGGVITDLQGAPINLETTSVLAAASPGLHQQALVLLNSGS